MKKKCLIIAHDFPPFSGGGVMRVHKFVKYLPQFNVEPYILTIKDKYYAAYDNTLLKEYGASVKIFRTPTIDLKWIYRLLKRKKNVSEITGVDSSSEFSKILDKIQSSVFIPDYKMLWIPFCLYNAVKIIKKYSIKNILITSPPHSAQLTGIFLKKFFPDINLIIDFRDLWTQYMVYTYPFDYVKKIEKLMELKVIENADKIICATESVKNSYIELSDRIDKSKFSVITNGFDEDDFSADEPEQYFDKNKFNIVYSGSLNDWRNFENFVNALQFLDNEHKIDKTKFTVYFYGHITQKDLNIIKNSEFENNFKIHGPEPHSVNILKLKQADILLLIIGKQEGSEVLTGKIFEYIGSRKKIFGIVPENGEAWNMINNNGFGITAKTDSIEDIKNKFLEIYENFFNDRNFFNKTDNDISLFTRKNLTEKLSNIINN